MLWRFKNFARAAKDLGHSIFNRDCKFEFNSIGSTIDHSAACTDKNGCSIQTLRLFY